MSISNELLISAFFTFVCILFYGTAFFYVEGQRQPLTLGDACWWSLETITSLGYGDITPKSPRGRQLASAVSLTGVLVLALPSGIFGSRFIEIMVEEKEARELQKAAQREQRRLRKQRKQQRVPRDPSPPPRVHPPEPVAAVPTEVSSGPSADSPRRESAQGQFLRQLTGRHSTAPATAPWRAAVDRRSVNRALLVLYVRCMVACSGPAAV